MKHLCLQLQTEVGLRTCLERGCSVTINGNKMPRMISIVIPNFLEARNVAEEFSREIAYDS